MEIIKKPFPEISISKDEMQINIQQPDIKMVFLVVGRLHYRKGHAFLLDALKKIPEEFDWECRIIGGGPEYRNINKICQSHPILKRRVVLTGEISYAEVGNEYNKADVFIMPSIRETTGAVLLEAMAHGMPIITINKFGGAVLLDDSCAWLYEGNNLESYIDSLASCIIECIKNPQEVAKKGAEARRRAEQYTWEEKDKFYCEIYKNLIQ